LGTQGKSGCSSNCSNHFGEKHIITINKCSIFRPCYDKHPNWPSILWEKNNQLQPSTQLTVQRPGNSRDWMQIWHPRGSRWKACKGLNVFGLWNYERKAEQLQFSQQALDMHIIIQWYKIHAYICVVCVYFHIYCIYIYVCTQVIQLQFGNIPYYIILYIYVLLYIYTISHVNVCVCVCIFGCFVFKGGAKIWFLFSPGLSLRMWCHCIDLDPWLETLAKSLGEYIYINK
jgi:hypothetical protein